MFDRNFDFLGSGADLDFDGHVDSFEAGAYLRMMAINDMEISRKQHVDLDFDEDLGDDFDLQDMNF